MGSTPTAGILNNPNSSGRPRNSQGKAQIITERGLEVRVRGLRPIRDGFALNYVSSGLLACLAASMSSKTNRWLISWIAGQVVTFDQRSCGDGGF